MGPVRRALAIHHPAGRLSLKANPFGKDVANLGLFRALAADPALERLHVAVNQAVSVEDLRADLGCSARLQPSTGSILDMRPMVETGALLRGQPSIAELGWRRRATVGGRAFSLIGLVHTLAPQAVRAQIAEVTTAPVHPWDALVATSPAVHDGLTAMLDDWEAHLLRRLGGTRVERPALPVIPLGVDGPALAARADRPQAHAARRAALGVGGNEVLVLWVGRLSFFEKAFPQPMFSAVQAAATATGVRLHFALAGWFPDTRHETLYREAAQALAPDVAVHLLNGNDADLVGELWAAADIFLSLVDNVQETFGITPLEAKAAGLPVVAGDWDGYRSTVTDGVDGFLAPTLGAPPGRLGQTLAARHALGIDTYQQYAGAVAQHTAVDTGFAAARLTDLVRDPGLRRRMGAAGRASIAATFDWPRVTARYLELADTLAEARRAAVDPEPPGRPTPVRGDPFADFAGFATGVLGPETVIELRGDWRARLSAEGQVRLDALFAAWRGSPEEVVILLKALEAGPAPVARLLECVPLERRPWAAMSLTWLAKLGVVGWSR